MGKFQICCRPATSENRSRHKPYSARGPYILTCLSQEAKLSIGLCNVTISPSGVGIPRKGNWPRIYALIGSPLSGSAANLNVSMISTGTLYPTAGSQPSSFGVSIIPSRDSGDGAAVPPVGRSHRGLTRIRRAFAPFGLPSISCHGTGAPSPLSLQELLQNSGSRSAGVLRPFLN
jgi:hypothetical protein